MLEGGGTEKKLRRKGAAVLGDHTLGSPFGKNGYITGQQQIR